MASETDAALFREYAGELADKYQLPRDFVQTVFEKESSYRPDAVSPAGALGIAQLMPDTAKARGVDPMKPVQALETGVQILAENYQRFGGDLVKTYAGYNSNPDKVEERLARGFRGLPAETQAAVEWLAERSPSMQKQLGMGGEPTPAPSQRMPLMTDAADPVDRVGQRMPLVTEALAGEGRPLSKGPDAVNPDANALMVQDMARQRDAQPWYAALPQRALEPLAELGIQGTRAATGSTLPRLPTDRLVTDAAQAAALLPLPVGRIASAAIQGGAGLAAGLQSAAERHATTGGSWEDQVKALDLTDALVIGGGVVAGSTLGALFPGRAARPFSPEGGIANARRDLGDLMARTTAEQALPPPRAGEVAAAFGRLNRDAVVDATGWRNALLQHGAVDGMSVPREVQAVADRLVPEMRTVTRPGSLAGHTFLPAVMPVETVQVPTGRYFARVGDLLDANMRLGNMVNTVEARQATVAASHNIGNLNALRSSLTDQIMTALPEGQRALYATARETSREVAQATAGMRFLERFLNPSEGILNGQGLFRALTEGGGTASRREVLQRRFGTENYRMLLDFARSVQRITSTPEKVPTLQHALSLAAQASGIGGAYAYGGPAGAAAALAARTLYGMATSRQGLRALDAMARAPVGSQAFTAAAGRLALAQALLATETAPPSPHPIDQLLGAPQ